MNRRILLSTLAGLALATYGSQAYAFINGPAALNPANHAEWDENGYFNSFGGAPPAGTVEFFISGFGTTGNFDGRVISNSSVTTNTADGTVLTSIVTDLWTTQDANLYKIQITNPSTFSASLPGTGNNLVLALFKADGTAVQAAIGGAGSGDTITGAPSAGIYYIGIGDPNDIPLNSAGQNLFGITASTPGVYSPAALSDITLGTNAYTAWSLPGGSSGPLLGNGTLLATNSTITLTGAGFAVVPEPTTLGILGAGSLGLLARRRKRA